MNFNRVSGARAAWAHFIAISMGFASIAHAAPAKPALGTSLQMSMDREAVEKGQLNPMFKGVPLDQMIAALERRKLPPRAELETSADYAARMDKAAEVPLIGNVAARDVMTFVVSPAREDSVGNDHKTSGAFYRYDADKGQAKVFLRLSKRGHLKSELIGTGKLTEYTMLTLDERQVASDSYVGTNAFGARMRVKRFGYLGHGLAAPFEPNGEAVLVDLPRAEAATELSRLKLALIFKLSRPNPALEEERDAATIDSPTEIITRTKYLVGTLRGYVVFSGLSGKVFGRVAYGDTTALFAQ